MNPSHWRLWIDTGGTFTDCLGLDPTGQRHRAKVLSSSRLRGAVVEAQGAGLTVEAQPWGDLVRGYRVRGLQGQGEAMVLSCDATHLTLDQPLPFAPGDLYEVTSGEEAPILAARVITGTSLDADLPPMEMRLATTLGTNALLTGSSARTALFLTEGFGDLLMIGTQQRPDLFALDIPTRQPANTLCLEVRERILAEGEVEIPLDLEHLRTQIQRARDEGCTAAAVALLNSHRHPEHEQRVGELLREAGFDHVSLSSDLAPTITILPGAHTARVNATLAPVVDRYLDHVAAKIPGSTLRVMTSAGGLVPRAAYQPKDSLLSGPAGGVVGASHFGEKILGFDMGGTSTDVSRFDGEFAYVFEHRVGDAHLVAPALAIETVAAGGGSICLYDAQGLRVGPESASAFPGPACYGAGGPLTITDVNLLSGHLLPDRFGIPVSPARAEEALEGVRDTIAQMTGTRPDRDELLQGFLDLANETMADATRRVSVRQGYDPADHTLVGFGGAGGQHACGVAERLGCKRVLIPADAGLLSALGLGHARIERMASIQPLAPLEGFSERSPGVIEGLGNTACDELLAEGLHDVAVRRVMLDLRFVGQDSFITIDLPPATEPDEAHIASLFAAEHRRLYGHCPSGRAMELVSVRVLASDAMEEKQTPSSVHEEHTPTPAGHHGETPFFQREDLRPGAVIEGPALILEAHATTVLLAGWRAVIDGQGSIVATHTAETEANTTQSELVALDLFTHRFTAIAETMGAMLERTALSTNVKERLDFSCALLSAEGELVVNAPHVPVHLGAMGLCVREVAKTLPMQPGDVIVTNHPAVGGSHLPDITVITPVFDEENTLLGYAANRAHHAEIGGTRPGSMPPDATTLAEEGVVIAPMHLMRAGESQEASIQALLTQGPNPSRDAEANLADLRAQIAANHRGAEALRQLARDHGSERIHHFMGSICARAEARIRDALARLANGTRTATEHLDDGAALSVAITIQDDSAIIDFTGTSATHPGNLNATPAIVRSAVMYVLRLLIAEPLPLNEGMMRAVRVVLPEGTLLNPAFVSDPAECPAVVGGNVETSQRLVDTLLRALGLAACSQGTMNNTLFGDATFGHYETLGGGAGAGPGWHGASGVHTHMTNTRITDPEILEHRYPVHLARFALRPHSGGKGQWQGGDGLVREYVFESEMEISVLTQHRQEAPYGVEGGEPGKVGRQTLTRSDGTLQPLKGIDGATVHPGDRLTVETPGGGGWGVSEGQESDVAQAPSPVSSS